MVLEVLLKEGWEQKGEFAGWQILGKEQERLLYDPGKQAIYLKYTMGGDNGGM